jgi:uncharacterized protein (TIGR02996 family)
MAIQLHAGEREWLSKVVSNLADDDLKLSYAEWLEKKRDPRGEFLRRFAHASRTMQPGDFPSDERWSEWADLLGFRVMEAIAHYGVPDFKPTALRLARPALRMVQVEADDEDLPVGASKIGGLPDLPADFAWPPGGDCHAIYNDDTGGTDRLAGFMAQVNLAEIAQTQAAQVLPKSGLLSFFCFQDIENDNPDSIGALAAYFPAVKKLKRTSPPQELTEGNDVMETRKLDLEETLDLPAATDGPWTEELRPGDTRDYDDVLDVIRSLNFENILGYGRATTGGDPTPSKQSRHLILLTNAAECRLHIQIPEDQLAARNFAAITLNWVDFD